MGKKDIKDLQKFLKPFGIEISELVLWSGICMDLYPSINELICNNYNA
jgi:hypothetical protein